jgi:hypothetical protein
MTNSVVWRPSEEPAAAKDEKHLAGVMGLSTHKACLHRRHDRLLLSHTFNSSVIYYSCNLSRPPPPPTRPQKTPYRRRKVQSALSIIQPRGMVSFFGRPVSTNTNTHGGVLVCDVCWCVMCDWPLASGVVCESVADIHIHIQNAKCKMQNAIRIHAVYILGTGT